MKKFIAAVLCLLLVLLVSAPAFAQSEITVRNVNDVWNLGEGAEPAIYKTLLYSDGKTAQSVYCVVCDGMDLESVDPNNARSITNAVKLTLSCENNAYVKTVCSAVLNSVPEGEEIVFLGRSMGGMVVQQVIAQSTIKSKYDIKHTLAIGSPFIITSQIKEGELRRVVDRLDVVPYLSIAGLANPFVGNVCSEFSGVYSDVHFNSYSKAVCWSFYDCLGIKGGSAYLSLTDRVF